MSGRSKTKGVYFREGIAYIRYQDEHGTDVRESTKQRSAKVAEGILAKRKTEVAMRPRWTVENRQFVDSAKPAISPVGRDQ